MGSTRLPGKVLLPLGGRFELDHVVDRVQSATNIDTVVVATSTKQADDIIEWHAQQTGVEVFRGDEENVLDRMYRAAESVDADEVVRITADCPLLDPATVDEVIAQRRDTGVEYATNILERTFPRGLDVEVFTFESFNRVHEHAQDPAHLEHVTLYYRDNPDQFEFHSVTAEETFRKGSPQNRPNLRLTLDEAADYKLLRAVFDGLEYDRTPGFADAVDYIDEHGLADINTTVSQKKPK
ncbi:glycosyltransferase family protein [Halovenus salina]|nr:glycosyltransferase family protein [Halovenus salina]